MPIVPNPMATSHGAVEVQTGLQHACSMLNVEVVISGRCVEVRLEGTTADACVSRKPKDASGCFMQQQQYVLKMPTAASCRSNTYGIRYGCTLVHMTLDDME